MMNLEGECYCKAVTFSAMTSAPYPYMRCYCNFCRKTSGSGGYGINIIANAESLEVLGKENIGFHHGMEHDEETDELKQSVGGRYFCRECGSPLWAADPRWAEWIYPYASALTTALPKPPELLHIMLEFKPSWVTVPSESGNRHFQRYPDESIIDWHKRHRIYIDQKI
jgi:hypothetical protein